MIVINVLLDLILFLYNHIKSSKNEDRATNNNIANQIIFDTLNFSKDSQLICETLNDSGKEKGLSVTNRKIK